MNLQQYVDKYSVLRNIKRFGMESVISPQDLCGHGYGVANLFYLLCKELNHDISTQELFMVMNHDFAETYTGDLNRRVKELNSITEEAWNKIEQHTVPREVFTDESMKRTMKERTFKVFQLADEMEAYLYCKEEVMKGNSHLERAMGHYKKLVGKRFDELSMERKLIYKLYAMMEVSHGV